MRHRHLEHNRYTLAAIDAIIGRGSQAERDDLLKDARQDPTLAGRVADLCRTRLSRPDPEFFDRVSTRNFSKRFFVSNYLDHEREA